MTPDQEAPPIRRFVNTSKQRKWRHVEGLEQGLRENKELRMFRWLPLEHAAVAEHVVTEDRVQSEPVSGPIFLLTRRNTGTFRFWSQSYRRRHSLRLLIGNIQSLRLRRTQLETWNRQGRVRASVHSKIADASRRRARSLDPHCCSFVDLGNHRANPPALVFGL